MRWKDFKDLSFNEKVYKVEQLHNIDVEVDFQELNHIRRAIIYAKNAKDFNYHIKELEKFYNSYHDSQEEEQE